MYSGNEGFIEYFIIEKCEMFSRNVNVHLDEGVVLLVSKVTRNRNNFPESDLK